MSANASLNDQILSERRQTWHGVSRLLLWGTIEALMMTLLTVLFAINGPSVGMFLFGGILFVVVSGVVLSRIFARS